MRMFKKYNVAMLTLAVTVALSTTSCRKTLFQDPLINLPPGAAFETPARVEKTAIGMYDQLQNVDFFGGRVLIYADIRGIDANPNGQFGNMYQYNTLTASDATTANAWAGGYRTIGEANLFLQNLALNPNVITQGKLDQYTGEAKFIRSLSYFYLVNLWAQPYNFTVGATHLGVPIILTSSTDPLSSSNQVPRNTVAQVYDQMEKDLLDAELKLPVDYNDPAFSNTARATKSAAQALLARLYLYKKDYAKANTYADKVIASAKYGMNPDPLTVFRTYTTKESIFSVAHNGGDNPSTNFALGQHYAPDRRGDITLSSLYLALLEPQDLRFKNLIRKNAAGSSFTGKYTGSTDWVPVLRYPELLLIKAEALANISTAVDANAVSLVNQVRGRSLASVIAPATKADLIAAILKERRIELSFEGQGIFDFLRTGRDIPAHTSQIVQPFGSSYVVLPIPQRDVQINKTIVQNPGY